VADHDAATTGLTTITDLAVGPDGLVYVLDLSDRVVVIDPDDGSVVRSWGRGGSGPGEFDVHTVDGNPGHGAIAVGPDGRVYVGDGANHRYQVFGTDGTFERQVGSFGTGDGQFSRIFHIAADGAGDVYAVDVDLQTVSKFDPQGRFLWRIGRGTGTPLGGIPQSVVPRPDGRLFQVVEEGPVLELDPADGHIIDRWDIGPTGWISFDSAGRAYATDYEPPAVQVFLPDHRLLGGAYGPEHFRFIVVGPHDELVSWPGGFDGSFQVLAADLPEG
jgi:DNA-binding beta-propeller fold protein YncE